MNVPPYLFNTYKRQPVSFVRGRGPWLWDDRGKKYLDFFSGLAVCNLGHAHPAVARAVAQQVKTLLHTSNIYYTRPQQDLARALSRRTFGGRVFFCNSGAEANEGAIKLARRFGTVRPGRRGPRHEIIVFDHAFHGRTLGALSATPQKKYQANFGPLVPGFKVARFGDLASVKAVLTDKTCAVLVEPIQGEGGVRVASPVFFAGLAALCRKNNLLLMFDEVQTGLGRTGTLYAYQNRAIVPAGVKPDVLTSAKGLANGLPIGAILAKKEIADLLQPGDHASTFGGGAVPSRAALAVLSALNPAGLTRVRRVAAVLRRELERWPREFPFIKAVRGSGHMLGLELDRPGADVVTMARKNGLLINCTADRVLRLLPPLVLTESDARRGLALLKETLKDFATQERNNP